jgi:hypothetical protein
MTDLVNVVNTALRLIGSARITSLTDGSTPANIANDIVDDLIDDLLRQHAWNFATKRVKLAQVSTAPIFEFDHAYALPSDWIRTVSAYSDSSASQRVEYRQELIDLALVLVTSADELWLEYVARVKDPNLWSADFRRAFSSSLARDMSISLANSNKTMELMALMSRIDLARARSTDAMGSTPAERPRGSWITSRGGGRGPVTGS